MYDIIHVTLNCHTCLTVQCHTHDVIHVTVQCCICDILTTYLAPFPSYGTLFVKFSLAMGVPHFSALARGDLL